MKENGFVVTLFAELPVIMERVKQDTSRPLLQGDMEDRVRKIWKEREGKYGFGDLLLDTGILSPQEATQEIAAIVRRSAQHSSN